MYASRLRKDKLSDHDRNCQRNVSDLEDCLVTCFSASGQLQRRPDGQTFNAGDVVQAADGGLQMLPMSNVRDSNRAVHHILRPVEARDMDARNMLVRTNVRRQYHAKNTDLIT